MFAGKEIVTPEFNALPQLQKVKEAFKAAGAAQCGYCIPGMVIAVTALLNKTATPSKAQAIEALQTHLCRCGTQQRVLNAVEALSNG